MKTGVRTIWSVLEPHARAHKAAFGMLIALGWVSALAQRLVTILVILQRTAGAAFRGRVIIYVVGATLLLVWVAGLAVLDAERGQDGSIQTLGEGIWWAFVTVTTVGYGDYFPVTPTGQLVAVGVMIGGIALIGVVTATLASWIIEKVSATNQADRAATKAHIDELMVEVRQLRELLESSK